MRIDCSPDNIRTDSVHLRALSAAARLIEDDDDYATWSWKVELENLSRRPLQVYIEVCFLDAEGFTLEDVFEGQFPLPAGKVSRFSKTWDLKRSLSRQVRDIAVQLTVPEDDEADDLSGPGEFDPALG